MPYTGEPSNFGGGDQFVQLITEEDLRVLRDEIPRLIQTLKQSLHSQDIRTYSHRVASKVIAVTVDGGNQPVFPEIPAIGMGLVRVSCASDNLKQLPESFSHIVRYRNLAPVFGENTIELTQKRRQEMDRLWNTPLLQDFSRLTNITAIDVGTSFLNNPQSFISTVRDVMEWAYICNIISRYASILDIVVVKDGRLEQHGVNNSFVQKLRTFFTGQRAKVAGVIKTSKLLNGSNGISLLVIAEWIRDIDREFYFKVPYELMAYVHLHERVWNPEYINDEGDPASFSFGYRYVSKMFPVTFRPLDTVFSLEIPSYFQDHDQEVDDIIAAILTNRSLLFGGSFAPTVEAHAQASISDHVRHIVQDYLVHQTGFHYPFS